MTRARFAGCFASAVLAAGFPSLGLAAGPSAVRSGMAVPPVANAPALFPDTPEHHWLYSALTRLKKEGLMVGYPDGLVNHEPERFHERRIDFAKRLCVIAHNLVFISQDLESDMLQVSREELGSARATTDLKNINLERASWYWPRDRTDLLAVERAATEFAPELVTLGSSPGSIIGAVRLAEALAWAPIPAPGSALNQFSDVPAEHWAAQAVLELRRAGILDGYPSGSFDRP